MGVGAGVGVVFGGIGGIEVGGVGFGGVGGIGVGVGGVGAEVGVGVGIGGVGVGVGGVGGVGVGVGGVGAEVGVGVGVGGIGAGVGVGGVCVEIGVEVREVAVERVCEVEDGKKGVGVEVCEVDNGKKGVGVGVQVWEVSVGMEMGVEAGEDLCVGTAFGGWDDFVGGMGFVKKTKSFFLLLQPPARWQRDQQH